MQEPNNEIQDLHARLAEHTETKAPSSGEALTWFASEDDIKNIVPPSSPQQAAPQTPPSQTTSTQTQGPEKPQSETTNTVKVPDAIKRASAETATLMWDQLLTVLGTWRVNSRFKKRFSEQEKNIILEKNFEDIKAEFLEDENEKTLHRKFNRLLKERDKKIKAIPLNEDETKRHTDAFYQVFKVKDIALPPEYLLYANLGFTLIDRLIETEVD